MMEIRETGLRLASFTLQQRRKEIDMMKTLEVIGEAVRNSKYPFRKTEHQPKKARKHRYERRKIKEYLSMPEWLAEELA